LARNEILLDIDGGEDKVVKSPHKAYKFYGDVMDFIERWLHVSPDHGDGSLEALYAVIGAVIVLVIVFRRRLGGALDRMIHFRRRF
jgi:hypothetical protein